MFSRIRARNGTARASSQYNGVESAPGAECGAHQCSPLPPEARYAGCVRAPSLIPAARGGPPSHTTLAQQRRRQNASPSSSTCACDTTSPTTISRPANAPRSSPASPKWKMNSAARGCSGVHSTIPKRCRGTDRLRSVPRKNA